jgi:transposase
MKPYSEDLRVRIVKGIKEGMSKSGAARLFGVSLSSVKRYARIAERREPLKPRKGGGRPPKTGEVTKRLLEEDVKERPTATVSERRRFLQSTTGKILSDSTVGRLLKPILFSQKTDCGRDGTRRVAESSLASDGRRKGRSTAPGVRGRNGHQHLTLSALRLVTQGRTGAHQGVA